MKLVKPSIKFLNMSEDPLKAIELAGRTCYKSEDKITEDSAEKFVSMLLKRGHHAMIEHGNFILSLDGDLYDEILKIEDRQYIRMSCDQRSNGCLISGNPRAFRDFCLRPDIPSKIQRAIAITLSQTTRLLFDDTIRHTTHLTLEEALVSDQVELFDNTDNLSVSEKLKHQIASYRIVCNRGFTHENVRHRPFSYAQESTRYCNYKGGVTYIIPPWITDIAEGEYSGRWAMDGRGATQEEIKYRFDNLDIVTWFNHLVDCESKYKNLLGYAWAAQQARGVLPIDLKTEIVVTGNLQQWKTFFGLRCTPVSAPKDELQNGIWYHASAPHPQMQEIANMILKDIQKKIPVIFDI